VCVSVCKCSCIVCVRALCVCVCVWSYLEGLLDGTQLSGGQGARPSRRGRVCRIQCAPQQLEPLVQVQCGTVGSPASISHPDGGASAHWQIQSQTHYTGLQPHPPTPHIPDTYEEYAYMCVCLYACIYLCVCVCVCVCVC
jgi:hypothetical protein